MERLVVLNIWDCSSHSLLIFPDPFSAIFLAVCPKHWTVIKYISQVSCFLVSNGFAQRKAWTRDQRSRGKVWAVGVIFFPILFSYNHTPKSHLPRCEVYDFWNFPHPFLTVAPKKWLFMHDSMKSFIPSTDFTLPVHYSFSCLFRPGGSNSFHCWLSLVISVWHFSHLFLSTAL